MRRVCFPAFVFLCLVLLSGSAGAATVTVSATGEYVLGDSDTVVEGRKLALQDAKRIALEKVGTYIESATEVKSGAIAADDVRQFTAGLVRVEDLGESRRLLEGKATVITVSVRVLVDPDDVVRQVLALKNRKDAEQQARKLSGDNDRLRREIDVLNRELRTALDEKRFADLKRQREEALARMLENEKGLTLLVSGRQLLAASQKERKQRQDERQLAKTFAREVAAAYAITSRAPEVKENEDGTFDVVVPYKLRLPGRFDSNGARIAIPAMGEISVRGVSILSFANGGLIFRCAADGRRPKCSAFLNRLEEEVAKLRVNTRMGRRVSKERIGLSESRRTPPRGATAPARPPYPPPSPGLAASSRYAPPIPRADVQIIHYPLVSSGSYAARFAGISREELDTVSSIVVTVTTE